MPNEDKFSKFDVFSYGGGRGNGGEDKFVLDKISDLRQRIYLLSVKMDELSMRPRMPYTQGHFSNQKLTLESDGNTEPDWSGAEPITSDTRTITTDLAVMFGSSYLKNVSNRKVKVRQPHRYKTVSGSTVSTTTTTTTGPLLPQSTTTETIRAVGFHIAGSVEHFEQVGTSPDVFGWAFSYSFSSDVWPEGFEPDRIRTESTTTTETITAETTTITS
jgi:hypothetical protein